MDTITPLIPGNYYHVYNRGNNKENLFKSPENYYYFLKLWAKHIDPVAETFCYNLLPNHFHFFVRIREQTSQGSKTCEVCSKAFSNLFNAYSKAINKRYGRTGSLFQNRFRRKEITGRERFVSVVRYILNNAVKHGFCQSAEQYPHSSYFSIISDQLTEQEKQVLEWFGGRARLLSDLAGR
jgi:REP element-mobilizing transposase RayT